MADPAPPQDIPASLDAKIRSAPEEVWKKIAAALGVGTRDEAVNLVSSNPGAAAQVESILGSAGGDTSVMTDQIGAEPAPAEDQLFPSMAKSGKKKKVTF